MKRSRWVCGLGVTTVLLLTLFAIPVTATHTVESGPLGWGTPSLLSLSDSSDDARRPQLAVGGGGNATVVWEQDWVQGFASVLASRYVPGTGWGPGLDVAFAVNASSPDVAMNPNRDPQRDDVTGQAYDTIAAWQQGGSIYVSQAAPETGWSPPQAIGETAAFMEANPQVTMDAAGNALVVWEGRLKLPSGRYQAGSVYASRFTPSTGWIGPVDIDTGGPRDAREPRLSVSANGDASVVWRVMQWGGTNPGVYATQFTPATGWGTTVRMGSWTQAFASSVFPSGPQVAMDAGGNTTVVWFQEIYPSPQTELHARLFDRESGWGPDRSIERGLLREAHIAMDASGNAIAVWLRHQCTCSSSGEVYASRFTPGAGWETSLAIGEVHSWSSQPQVALLPGGDAIAAWGSSVREFHPGSGWGPIERLAGDITSLAMNADGIALTVGTESKQGGYAGIVANRYLPGAGWTGTEIRANSLSVSTDPHVAVDAAGNAMAVWHQGPAIFAKLFAPNPGRGWAWSTAEVVGIGTSPRVAISPEGDALVVWEQSGRIQARLWNRAEEGLADVPGAWWPVQTIGVGSLPQTFRSLSQLDIDSHGNAIVGWWHGNGIYANVFARGAGWGTAELLATNASSPEVAIDEDGNALAVWLQSDSTVFPDKIWTARGSVRTNRFVPGTGWGQIEDIQVGAGTDLLVPRLAMNADGQAFAVWGETDSPQYGKWNVYARQFIPRVGWGRSEGLGEGDIPHFAPPSYDIALNRDGHAVVVVGGIHIFGNAHYAHWFVPGTGWGVADQLPSGLGGGVRDLELDAKGNALLATQGYGGFSEVVRASLFTPAEGWGPALRIHGREEFGYSAVNPEVGMDGVGNAIIVWGEELEGGGWSIYANRFVRALEPDLFINSPRAVLTNHPRVRFAGVTSPGARVTIGGTPVPVNVNGGFELAVTLADGTHAFEVVATRAEGSTSAIVSITVDTRAPSLALERPGNGATVETSTVTVVGTTEPGAYVIVDGITAGVAPDGSFALKVALSEGKNTVTATATDEAGNVAVVSLSVNYAGPVSGLLPQVTFLWAALLASSSALFILLLLRYRNWLTRGQGMGRNAARSKETILSAGGARRPEAGSGLRPRADATSGGTEYRPWPQTPAASPLHLTAKERVMLHLLDYTKYTDAVEVPRELTQGGVSQAAGFDRRHFTQYVRQLLQKDLVEERNTHVEGVLQRQRVYALSYAGWHKALGLRDRIQATVVSIVDEQGVRAVPIADVLENGHEAKSLLEVVREAIETGQVDLRS